VAAAVTKKYRAAMRAIKAVSEDFTRSGG